VDNLAHAKRYSIVVDQHGDLFDARITGPDQPTRFEADKGAMVVSICACDGESRMLCSAFSAGELKEQREAHLQAAGQ
jgi:hypothetical protein